MLEKFCKITDIHAEALYCEINLDTFTVDLANLFINAIGEICELPDIVCLGDIVTKAISRFEI